MHPSTSSLFFATPVPPPEYRAAAADVERRALAGQLTLAQARQEIFALRERFAPQPMAPARRAASGRS
ncbi:hypothetical protein [Azohydromonas aeria]|uniref:hypothetical protein n=1 Tax=Azohydromonas aeria TaxID=2590212 RepID=UPI0012FB0708|nr:hypothetical protein [Azohydromonas aeria]